MLQRASIQLTQRLTVCFYGTDPLKASTNKLLSSVSVCACGRSHVDEARWHDVVVDAEDVHAARRLARQVDIDIGAFKSESIFTRLAKSAIGAVQPFLSRITIDLAFLLCATSAEELPERLLGVVRLHRVRLQSMAD